MNIVEVKDLISRRVIDYYLLNPPVNVQILHTQAVASYARYIALNEGEVGRKLELHEMAAWLHDIGCPMAIKMYGNSLPVHQQELGRIEASKMISDIAFLSESEKEWLVSVVGSHHQKKYALELGFAPLFDADIIVNVLEGYFKKENAQLLKDTMVITKTGKALFDKIIL